MKQPLVSCIMPTADRSKFIPYAIDYFLHQDYPNAELIIIDSGNESVKDLIPLHHSISYEYSLTGYSLGTMRNLCCNKAKGEIIIHLDDDDWYAENWITEQMHALTNSGADITGLSDINYFVTDTNKRWEYKNTGAPWVYGATLAYRKAYWEENPFKELNTGEDNIFISNPAASIHVHHYTEGYLGMIHDDNAGIRVFEDPKEKLILEKWFKKIDHPEQYQQDQSVRFEDEAPLVTCIMPTANRANFIRSSIDIFLKQDYPNKELVIIDDGEHPVKDLIPENHLIRYFYYTTKNTVGAKRNLACEKAEGKLITHWDDDDWYAPDWISRQVNAFMTSGADISGINQVQFFSPSLKKYWMTKNRNSKRPWLTGQSLIYRKSFWEKHPFKDLQVGEDDDFVRNNKAKVYAHDYFQGFIATVHPHNTSVKFFGNREENPSQL